MRTLFGAACAIATLAGTSAFAQSNGYYQDQGGYYQNQQGGYYQNQPQNQAQYDEQRQQYEDSQRAYQQRREDYEANRNAYEQNRENYRENYNQYRREYRRWARGAYLPYEYRNRWGTISNWSYYHLRRPGSGYVWVYDGDAYLLINRHTGYIADVVNPGDRWFVPYGD